MSKLLKYQFDEYNQIEIYPLSDLHIGDGKTDLKLFEEFKTFILEKQNRFIILNGDLMNNAIKTSVSNVYNETMNPNQQKKFVIENLKPLKDRILGITSGNHEHRSKKETDTDLTEDIAYALGLEEIYDDAGVFIKINVGRNNRNQPISYIIHAVHGNGGGKQLGSGLNNLDFYGSQYEGVDVFIMGHIHKKIAGKTSKVVVDLIHESIKTKEIAYVTSGSWQDYLGGYAQRMMLKASTKGTSTIVLDGTKKQITLKL